MRVDRPWSAILGVLFVLAAGCSGCTRPDSGPKPPLISTQQRHTLLSNYLCAQAAKEDAENGGLRANGKPWTLENLIADASAAYAKEQLKSEDVVRGRKMIAATLAFEPTSISLAELCRRANAPVTTRNRSVDEPLAAAIAIASPAPGNRQ